MKIISCQNHECGVLLDGDIFLFPDNKQMYLPDNKQMHDCSPEDDCLIDERFFRFHNGEWTAWRACPVCKEPIHANDC